MCLISRRSGGKRISDPENHTFLSRVKIYISLSRGIGRIKLFSRNSQYYYRVFERGRVAVPRRRREAPQRAADKGFRTVKTKEKQVKQGDIGVYRQFINFSGYSFDLEKFNSDWGEFRKFLAANNLDGAEMLLDFAPLDDGVPKDLVAAVHFPSFMGWYRLWTDKDFTVPTAIDKSIVKYFYGGDDTAELISNFRSCIADNAKFSPAYGVFHAGYMEAEHTFMKKMPVADSAVLDATAELLNEVAGTFAGGEMPYPIAIENLWWAGLTFLTPSDTSRFADRLEFENWFFLLDTGHLMNAGGAVFSEEEGIGFVLDTLRRLSADTLEKIRAVHFHFSASGEYQRRMKAPDNFDAMPFEEQSAAIMAHLKNFDQHRPFTLPECKKIIDFVKPDYVTHEFMGTRDELEAAVNRQLRALK